jgi:hypothetical protein
MEQGAPLRTVLTLIPDPSLFRTTIEITPQLNDFVWDIMHGKNEKTSSLSLQRFAEEVQYLQDNFYIRGVNLADAAASLFITGVLMRKNSILPNERTFSALNWGTSSTDPEQDYRRKSEYLKEIGYIV